MITDKVVITEEAEFDYMEVVGLSMPKKDIKSVCEDYLEIQQENRRLQNGYYFRIKYLDEETNAMVWLFFYKGEKLGSMQFWELKGVCREDEWSETLEDEGQVRLWLKTKITPDENEPDWVWDLRIREEEKRRLLEEEYGEVKKVSMVKELLKNYKLNKAKIAVGGDDPFVQELKVQMERLDRCIETLDDLDKTIITDIYIRRESLSKVAKRFGFAKTSTLRMRDRAVKIVEILYGE